MKKIEAQLKKISESTKRKADEKKKLLYDYLKENYENSICYESDNSLSKKINIRKELIWICLIFLKKENLIDINYLGLEIREIKLV